MTVDPPINILEQEALVVHKRPDDDVASPGDEAHEETTTTTNEPRAKDVEHDTQLLAQESFDDLGRVQDYVHTTTIKYDDDEEDNIPLKIFGASTLDRDHSFVSGFLIEDARLNVLKESINTKQGRHGVILVKVTSIQVATWYVVRCNSSPGGQHVQIPKGKEEKGQEDYNRDFFNATHASSMATPAAGGHFESELDGSDFLDPRKEQEKELMCAIRALPVDLFQRLFDFLKLIAPTPP
ncbi:hypothetical protein Sjap_017774 [Stephania japonica]|uniref:Uncharacterized protein n=1 Tax=Stephania japonica TaxID=461633 RepID=A0AAP0I6U9_9MAGN